MDEVARGLKNTRSQNEEERWEQRSKEKKKRSETCRLAVSRVGGCHERSERGG